MKRLKREQFLPAHDRIVMTPGEMLSTLRGLQKLTQAQLAGLTGISQANISSLECGRQQIGRDRALVLARALKVHPAVIMFPNYTVSEAA
jgi:transcriptional regulator with XRE-family HTH domain